MAVFKRWRSCQFAGCDWVLHTMAYLVLKSKNETLVSWGGKMDGWVGRRMNGSAPLGQSERWPLSTCRSWLYKSPRTAAREQSPYSSPASYLFFLRFWIFTWVFEPLSGLDDMHPSQPISPPKIATIVRSHTSRHWSVHLLIIGWFSGFIS